MSNELLSGRPLRILYKLYKQSKLISAHTLEIKQSEFAKELGITRQALNIHLRRLRDGGYIRTGRGFIDITDDGLKILGISVLPTFVFVKVLPHKRTEAYKTICELPIQRVYRVAGDMDLVIVVHEKKLDAILKRISQIDGVEDTRSYISIESLK